MPYFLLPLLAFSFSLSPLSLSSLSLLSLSFPLSFLLLPLLPGSPLSVDYGAALPEATADPFPQGLRWTARPSNQVVG